MQSELHFKKSLLFVVLFGLFISIMFLYTPKASANVIDTGNLTEVNDGNIVLVSKTFTGETNGAWKDCTAAASDDMNMLCSKIFTVSNSYTGSLKVSKSTVDASLGFNITGSSSTTMSASKVLKKGQRIQYRYVYDNYKVKQDQYRRNNVIGGTKVVDTAYLYPKKFSHVEFRVY